MAFQTVIKCSKCSCTQYTQLESKDSQGRRRIKAMCAKCQAYIKFLPIHDDLGNFEMPFGKHKGKKLSEIPKEYLEWASNNFSEGPVLRKINDFMYEEER